MYLLKEVKWNRKEGERKNVRNFQKAPQGVYYADRPLMRVRWRVELENNQSEVPEIGSKAVSA